MKTNNKYLIALIAALGIFPVVLDTTIVNVGLIPISKALKSDFNTIQWIAAGYMLANAAMICLSGYLGSRYGVKRLFIAGIALFGLFSFFCGLAPTEAWLIALRVVQGIGGGLILPLGLAIALEPFPREERIKGGVVLGIPLMLGPIIAPIVGGLIIDNLNWQYIFFINVPICLIAVFLGWRMLPADAARPAAKLARFDYPGLILSTLGIVIVVYAFKLVSEYNPATRTALNPAGELYGWGYWQVWVLLGVGSFLLVSFGVYELFFSADPVLDLRLFKNFNFALGNLISWVSASAMFGVLALIPEFFQQAHTPNLSAVDTGLALIPLGLASVVGMIICRKLYAAVGPRPLVVAGSILMTLSFWQLSNLTPTTAGGDIWPWLVLLGLSISLTGITVTTLATERLNGVDLNKGSSLFQATKTIFGAVGPTILITILVQQTGVHAQKLQEGLPVGTLTNPADPKFAQARQLLASQAATSGMNDIFFILVFVGIGLTLISLALPGRNPHHDPTAEAAEEPDVIMIA